MSKTANFTNTDWISWNLNYSFMLMNCLIYFDFFFCKMNNINYCLSIILTKQMGWKPSPLKPSDQFEPNLALRY